MIFGWIVINVEVEESYDVFLKRRQPLEVILSLTIPLYQFCRVLGPSLI